MFQPQKFLVEAVNNQDIEQVRVALSTYLSKNPTNEHNEVIEAAEYAERQLSEQLWATHDGLYIEKDPSKWTTEYLGQLKSDLRYNFSEKRFNFIIEVGQKVRPVKEKVVLTPTIAEPSRWTAGITKDSIHRGAADSGKSNTKWLVIAGLGGLSMMVTALILIT